MRRNALPWQIGKKKPANALALRAFMLVAGARFIQGRTSTELRKLVWEQRCWRAANERRSWRASRAMVARFREPFGDRRPFENPVLRSHSLSGRTEQRLISVIPGSKAKHRKRLSRT